MYKHFKSGYYVSNKGKVIRVRKNKKQTVNIYENKNGYLYFVILSTKKRVFIHRAVAITFIPQVDKTKRCVDHIDRDKKNNCVSNLRWVNYSENNKNRNSWRKGESETNDPISKKTVSLTGFFEKKID